MRTLTYLLFAVLVFGNHAVEAGTLGSVRRQVAQPRSNKGSQKKRHTKSQRKDEEEDDDGVGSAVAQGVLSAVSSSVRKNKKKQRPSGPRPRHGRPRRQQRSPLSFGLSVWDAPQPQSYTVVEEHHYYGAEPVGYTSVVAPPSATGYYPPMPATAPAPALAPPDVLPSNEMGTIANSSVIAGNPTIEAAPSEIVVPPSTSSETALVVPDHEFHFYEPWNVRFGAEYGTDTDDLSRFGFDFVATQLGGPGLDTSLRVLRESGDGFRDHLWLGDFNVMWDLFPTDRLRTRAGVGFNWLSDQYGSEAGLNLTLATELRITKRILMTGEVDFGNLGDADLIHSRVTAGFQHGPVEWYAGYDHLDIGGIEIQGVIGGLRFRF